MMGLKIKKNKNAYKMPALEIKVPSPPSMMLSIILMTVLMSTAI